MTEMLSVFLLIMALFLVLLGVKTIVKWKFCVLCASVSVTWMTLLVLYWLGRFENVVFIAVLMGESVIGLSSLLVKKTPEKLQIFRLPFVLGATLAVYLLLGERENVSGPLLAVGMVWVVFLTIYAYRNNARMRRLGERIIACCRDW